MKEIHAFLMFDGDCADAMRFYQTCLKAELEMKLYSEVLGSKSPPQLKNRIMNARLHRGIATLMGCDIMPTPDFKKGNNFTVSIACSSKIEVEEFMNALGEGGTITMPGQQTSMGAYFGMLTDRYQVDWMLRYEP